MSLSAKPGPNTYLKLLARLMRITALWLHQICILNAGLKYSVPNGSPEPSWIESPTGAIYWKPTGKDSDSGKPENGHRPKWIKTSIRGIQRDEKHKNG
jgi:hypothetical protein